MTDTTDNPNDSAELERLRAKNRELLAENRQLKNRNREQTEQIAALAARNRRFEVDGPVGQIIGDLAMTGAQDAFRVLLEQHVRFEAGDDGQLVIRNAQGEPVMLPAVPGTKAREIEREARATVEDVRALVDTPELRAKFAAITVASRASGGGAGGSSPGGTPREPRKPAPETRQEPRLGLR